MTVRTNDDAVRSSAEPRESTAYPTEGDEALERDRPVREVDTSGVTRTQHRAPDVQPMEASQVDPLFAEDAAADFRTRWDVVQRSFVDDPQQAVRAGDELVSEVIQALSTTFTAQRMGFENGPNPDQSSTESLRLAFRRYRSFFERLLNI
jgi:hypothetical protein